MEAGCTTLQDVPIENCILYKHLIPRIRQMFKLILLKALIANLGATRVVGEAPVTPVLWGGISSMHGGIN